MCSACVLCCAELCCVMVASAAWMITGILFYFHQTSLLKYLSGSQLAVWYYRAMGAKIGKGVLLNSLARWVMRKQCCQSQRLSGCGCMLCVFLAACWTLLLLLRQPHVGLNQGVISLAAVPACTCSNEPDCLTIGDGTVIDDLSFVMAHTTENRCVKFHGKQDRTVWAGAVLQTQTHGNAPHLASY